MTTTSKSYTSFRTGYPSKGCSKRSCTYIYQRTDGQSWTVIVLSSEGRTVGVGYRETDDWRWRVDTLSRPISMKYWCSLHRVLSYLVVVPLLTSRLFATEVSKRPSTSFTDLFNFHSTVVTVTSLSVLSCPSPTPTRVVLVQYDDVQPRTEINFTSIKRVKLHKM